MQTIELLGFKSCGNNFLLTTTEFVFRITFFLNQNQLYGICKIHKLETFKQMCITWCVHPLSFVLLVQDAANLWGNFCCGFNKLDLNKKVNFSLWNKLFEKVLWCFLTPSNLFMTPSGNIAYWFQSFIDLCTFPLFVYCLTKWFQQLYSF